METSSVRSHQNSADSSAVATPTSASGGSNSNNFRSTPTAKSALRRAAIDIIGRGFVLWEPHLEVSKVRIFLGCILSGHVPEIQAEVEVVKIKNPDFSCWAWSTPWGHVLSLKSFVGQKYRNIFVRFLVQMKKSKYHSEITWPLACLWL